MNDQVDKLLYAMLTENTGSHMLDSGEAYGRNWQRNQKKAIQDFIDQPSVHIEYYDGKVEYYIISVFHYLREQLELDDLCTEYNDLPCEDWDSEEYYGVSADQEKWLIDHSFQHHETINTYNFESSLSQVLQYSTVYHEPSNEYYVLMQIHGGCDVRGGYTDAKLFKMTGESGSMGFLEPENVMGSLNGIPVDSDGPYLINGDTCEVIDQEITDKDDFQLELYIPG